MRKNQVKQITMGAMILALVGLALVMDTFSAGFLLTTIPFLIPIPFVLYVREFGFGAGITVLAASFFLGMMVAPIYQVIFTVMYGAIGVFYGYGVLKDFNDKQLLFMTFFFVAIITMMTIILFGSVFGYNLIEELNYVIEITRNIIGASVEQYPVSMFYFLIMLTYIFQSILEAFVIHMLSSLIFLRMKLKPVRKVRFRDIKYPNILGYLSATLFLLMIYTTTNEILSEYALLISFLGTMGYSYLSYLGLLFFYKSERFNKWAVYSIIIFIMTLSFYSPLHMGIGLFTSVSGYWRK